MKPVLTLLNALLIAPLAAPLAALHADEPVSLSADLTALASATQLDPRDTGRLTPCRF